MIDIKKIYNYIKYTIEELGYYVLGIEFFRELNFSIFRVFIDCVNSISFNDCIILSHYIDGIFYVEKFISYEYNLEISSPGIDRPLFTLIQYRKYIGNFIKIQLRYFFNGIRKFIGLLVAIEKYNIVIQIECEEYLIPFDLINRSNILLRN